MRRSVAGGGIVYPGLQQDAMSAWAETHFEDRAERRGFARFVTYLAAVSVPPARVRMEQVEQKQKWYVSAGMGIVEEQRMRRWSPAGVRREQRTVGAARRFEQKKQKGSAQGGRAADSRQQAPASNGCSGN
jgi:hypothetical protein